MKTQTLRILTVFSFFACTLGIVSCGANNGNGVTCGVIWTNELQDELNALSEASMNYGFNPSPTTCQEYLNAHENYIKALRDLDNCVPRDQRDDYDRALDEALQDLEEQEGEC